MCVIPLGMTQVSRVASGDWLFLRDFHGISEASDDLKLSGRVI